MNCITMPLFPYPAMKWLRPVAYNNFIILIVQSTVGIWSFMIVSITYTSKCPTQVHLNEIRAALQ